MIRLKSPVRLWQDAVDDANGRTKTCPRCGTEKPSSEFNYSAAKPDKRQTKCEACDRATAVERRGVTEAVPTPPRPRKRICPVCCDLPHRVRGKRCRACGLQYDSEDCA